MDTVSVTITDHTLPAPVASKIEISVMEVVLNSHANLSVRFLDENGGFLKHEDVKIEGDEYDAWGLDDQYLIDLALSKLGLTQA